jgi:hypothetical protein
MEIFVHSSLEIDNLEVINYLSASKIWPDNRLERPYESYTKEDCTKKNY